MTTTLLSGGAAAASIARSTRGRWLCARPLLLAVSVACVAGLYSLPPGYLVRSMVDLIFRPAGAALSGHSHAMTSRPGTIVEPVSSEPLLQIPGLNIIVARVRFPPAALSPRHNHPGSVYVYVLEGSVNSQLLGGPPGTFGPGQSFFEPPGTVHLFAENASTVAPAEVLAVFITPPGVPLISYLTD
jgi:quercetin dioxygenase-like cupin family protein